jgi:hypothetical protein
MSKKTNWRKWRVPFMLAGIITALILFSGPGCGNQWILFYDKPIRGYVVDAETGKPIEDAIIVGMWDLAQFLGQGFGGYAKVIEVTTDKEGKFRLPFWVTFKPWKFHSGMNVIAPKIVIYKPGFKISWSHKIMRLGFPGDDSKTEDEKNKVRERYSLNPAKVQSLNSDEEIWEAFSEFESESDFTSMYYSKNQIKEVLNALEKGALLMSEVNGKSKQKILKDIYQYRKYWLEDNS